MKADLPDDVVILKQKPFPKLSSTADALVHALSNPLGAPRIPDQFREGDTVSVIINDHTRPIPTREILDVLLPMLKAYRVQLTIATGLHATPSPSDLEEILGGWSTSGLPIRIHDAISSPCDDYGEILPGIPLTINKEVAQADRRITIGAIAPHFFAGYSGGRKAILPGVAGSESILLNHRYENIDHPNARAGCLAENPIHEEMLRAAKMVGVDFSINVVLDAQHKIAGVFTGELEAAHHTGVQWLNRFCTATVPDKAAVVITSNEGYPLDRTLYQAVKGIYTASLCTKPGGTIIMAAECQDGVGHPNFQRLASQGDPSKILEDMRKRASVERDQWQVQILAKILQLYRVVVVTENISRTTLERMNLCGSKTIKEAFETYGDRDEKIIAIPNGPGVLPIRTGEE